MGDWQVGDLAVCVDDSPPQFCPKCGRKEAVNLPPLVAGSVYRVRDCGLSKCGGNYGLAVQKGKGGWNADRFHKIRPDEQEACEPEFVTLLKRSKRKVSA